MNKERKFLMGLIAIGIVLCAAIFIIKTILNLILSGYLFILIGIVIIFGLSYPIGELIEKKLKGVK